MQNTKTPLYLSLASIPINIGLSIVLSRTYGVVGLALSASIVAMLEPSDERRRIDIIGMFLFPAVHSTGVTTFV
jgi:hypothetical protein